jgi:O-methyltransferase involved in polyketide biosynthesis
MTEDSPGHGPQPSPGTGTDVPHSARIWNYWLGGDVNFPVDREAGDQYRQVYPEIVDAAVASRAFQTRAVRFLAGEAGIRQFLDVGAGLPAAGNTHEVAQGIAPESRIVYVDHDPFVVGYGRSHLASTPEGVTDFAEADLHRPEDVVAAAARTLDFSQPIALLLMGVMGHLEDGNAYPIVRHLVGALPPGSYLALYDGGTTSASDAFTEAQEGYDDTGAIPYHLRTPEEIAAFFDRLDLVEPGVVPVPRWRPADPGPPPDLQNFGGVARKPGSGAR